MAQYATGGKKVEQDKDFIHIRVPLDIKIEVQKRGDAGDYKDITDFVNKAIRDKLDPELRKKRLKEELKEIFDDREYRRELGLK